MLYSEFEQGWIIRRTAPLDFAHKVQSKGLLKNNLWYEIIDIQGKEIALWPLAKEFREHSDKSRMTLVKFGPEDNDNNWRHAVAGEKVEVHIVNLYILVRMGSLFSGNKLKGDFSFSMECLYEAEMFCKTIEKEEEGEEISLEGLEALKYCLKLTTSQEGVNSLLKFIEDNVNNEKRVHAASVVDSEI